MSQFNQIDPSIVESDSDDDDGQWSEPIVESESDEKARMIRWIQCGCKSEALDSLFGPEMTLDQFKQKYGRKSDSEVSEWLQLYFLNKK